MTIGDGDLDTPAGDGSRSTRASRTAGAAAASRRTRCAQYRSELSPMPFSSQYSVDTAKVLAFTSLSMLPALVFFSLFERRIVGGLTGAVKG